jgi:uncharacterized protein (TIGR03083 family)
LSVVGEGTRKPHLAILGDMPTSLGFDRHLEVLGAAAASLRERAMGAGMADPVPTCPRWTVTDLVAHQGMVHRWAAASLRGESEHDPKQSLEEAAATTDIFAWYTAGVEQLSATLEAVPVDVKAMVFLRDAPPPRHFWARRQAHETTIHGVDALAARLGRVPTAAETGIEPELAVDGIDELLCGFLPRGKGKPRFDGIDTLRMATTDTGHTWTLHYTPDRLETTPDGDGKADAVLAGTAPQLYLGLWNRGNEMEGPEDIVLGWKEQARIRWG